MGKYIGVRMNEAMNRLDPIAEAIKKAEAKDNILYKNNIVYIIAYMKAQEPHIISGLGADITHNYVQEVINTVNSFRVFDLEFIKIYAYIGLYIGLYFESDPQYELIGRIIHDNGLPEEEMIHEIYKVFHEQFWTIAGERMVNIETAIGRVSCHEITETGMRSLTDVNSLFHLLNSLWPQKAARQQQTLPKLLEAARIEASYCGFDAPSDAMLFAIIAFFLGCGFMKNPQHYWVPLVLNRYADAEPERRFLAGLREIQRLIRRDIGRERRI